MKENTFIDIYEIYGYIKFIRTNENWPFPKTRPWCSHAARHYVFSRSEKYIVEQRRNQQRADRLDRAGYFRCETNFSFQM